MSLEEQIGDAVGTSVAGLRRLSGGCVGDVYLALLADGSRVVAKMDSSADASLSIEGFMLEYLQARSQLPVPEVLHCDDRLLVMSYIESDGAGGRETECHAADLLVALHDVRADRFGLDRDTLIGGLHQPNTQNSEWVDFFVRRRLLYMADEACRANRLPGRIRARLDTLADSIDRWLAEPPAASLIHGDVWSGNVLMRDGRIAGLIDPAIYYADPEIELAFITLFRCFGQTFFDRYSEQRPIAEGFFEQRRDLYNLYPLLVHVRLFGGGYVAQVEGVLSRFGA